MVSLFALNLASTVFVVTGYATGCDTRPGR